MAAGLSGVRRAGGEMNYGGSANLIKERCPTLSQQQQELLLLVLKQNAVRRGTEVKQELEDFFTGFLLEHTRDPTDLEVFEGFGGHTLSKCAGLGCNIVSSDMGRCCGKTYCIQDMRVHRLYISLHTGNKTSIS